MLPMLQRPEKAYQITACTLFRLLKLAFDNEQFYSSDTSVSFEEWCQVKCEQQPNFKFWFMVMIVGYLD